MNNKQIQDLTLRLSHSLDQNYDVINFDAVLSVISDLEGATITKEQLETTRLAKYINQLRRRTQSEQLARRAKSLLKNWREMVGIQQQTAESFTSLQEYQKQKNSSQITIISSENGICNIFGKSSIVSKFPAALSGSANMKKKSLTGTTPTVPIPPVPTTISGQCSIQSNNFAISSQKQPTSFANLLTSISGGSPISDGAFDDMLRSPDLRKLNKRKDRHDGANKKINCAADQTKNNMRVTKEEPIVINIQDSNSNIGPAPTIAQNTIGDVSICKSKKNKRDRKRRGRDSQPQRSSALCHISDVIEESFSSLRPPYDPESEKFYYKRPISGISEILSLSNSSMTSMFPNNTVGNMTTTGTSLNNYQRSAETVGFSSNQSSPKTSDLTFAGKFKHHTLRDNVDSFVLTAGSPTTRVIAATVESTATVAKAPPAVHNFLPFGNSGSNSNESTSNSLTTQFDIINVNHDNSQSKIIELLRKQNKNQNACRTQTPVQNQDVNKTPVGSAFGVSQVRLTETSVVNLRQLNSGSVVSSDPTSSKKRGRKKGYKGVDSIIAKRTSLSSQMLMTTLGCKKVKTTKELYAEMQNRKLSMSSSTISPTLCNWLSHHQAMQVSRTDSSCSEPSLHSPRTSDACSTNATTSTVATRSTPDKTACNSHVHGEETESETNTSDPSRDSATIQVNLKRINVSSTDSTSNSQFVSNINVTMGVNTVINVLSLDSIEHEIKFLLTHFPPVPTIQKIEQDCFEDVLPCTCKVTENIPTAFNLVQSQQKKEDAIFLPTTTILKNNEGDRQHPQALFNYKTLIEDVKLMNTDPPPTQKVKKSIFDLDFDDEEDPLHQIRAEAVSNSPQHVKSEIMGIETKFIQNLKRNSKLDKKDISELLLVKNEEKTLEKTNQIVFKNLQVIIFPTYTVEEDTLCVAKEYYEVKKQKITEFHLTALHNYCIPNINGNWDNANAFIVNSNKSSEVKTINKKPLSIAELSTGDLCNNVVPQYGSLITEYIPKNLCHLALQSKFKPTRKYTKRPNDTLNNSLPFLGVAKNPLGLKKIIRKRKAKKNCVRESYSDWRTDNNRDSKRCNNKTTATCYIMRGKSMQNAKAEAYSNNDHTHIKYDDYNKFQKISYIKKNANFEQCCNDDELPSIYVASDIATDRKTNAVFINVESNYSIDSTGGVYPRTLVDYVENAIINISSNSSRVESDVFNRNLLTVEIPERLCERDKLSQQIVGGDTSCNQINTSVHIQNINTDNGTKSFTKDVAAEPLEIELREQETKKRRKREIFNKNKKKRKVNVEYLQIAVNGVASTQEELPRESASSSEENCEESGTESGTGNSNVKILQSDDEMLEYNFSSENCVDKDKSGNKYYYKADHDYTSHCRKIVAQYSSVSNKQYDQIVLTIKKTPSNINSSSGFISKMSSSVLLKSIPALNIFNSSNTNTGESISSKKLIVIDDKLIDNDGNESCYERSIYDVGAEDMLTDHSVDRSNDDNDKCNVSKQIGNIHSPSSHSEISTSSKNVSKIKDKYKRRMKIIKKSAKYFPVRCKLRQKLHRKLFLSDELLTNTFGLKEKILNISSCSSSCDENSDNECYTTNDQFKRSHYKDTTSLKNTSTTNSVENSQCSFYDCSDFDTNSSYCSVTNENCTISVNGDNIALHSQLATDDIKQDTTEKRRTYQRNKLKLEDDSEVYELNRDELLFRDENGELPLENNGLLKSFNNIYLTADEVVHNQRIHSRKISSSGVEVIESSTFKDIENIDMISHHYKEKEEKIRIKNCDVFSNYFNNDQNSKLDNSNSSLKESKESGSSNADNNAESVATTVKCKNDSPTVYGTQRTGTCSLEEAQLLSHREYRTGLRAVDEDVEDEEGSNCARIQQFKEWHQVLQLRSYKNELLTVLPYVVLE